MLNYLELLRRVRTTGTEHHNRTGITTRRISGAHLQFDLRDGFPLVTTKRVPFKSIVAELIGFLRGVDNASAFRDLGTKIWDQNANETPAWITSAHRKGRDDLGRIYGVQWRRWAAPHGSSYGPHVDQLQNALETIKHQPDSRRIIVNAWNPAEIDQMALPPCHVLWQVMPDATNKALDLCVYLRSWDLFLGGPFNIASYALLTELLATATGYDARTLNIFAADVHVYENHFAAVDEQLTRKETSMPMLRITESSRAQSPLHWLTEVLQPQDIELLDYNPQPAIPAPMAA